MHEVMCLIVFVLVVKANCSGLLLSTSRSVWAACSVTPITDYHVGGSTWKIQLLTDKSEIKQPHFILTSLQAFLIYVDHVSFNVVKRPDKTRRHELICFPPVFILSCSSLCVLETMTHPVPVLAWKHSSRSPLSAGFYVQQLNVEVVVQTSVCRASSKRHGHFFNNCKIDSRCLVPDNW